MGATTETLSEDLTRIGVTGGDTVLLHSSLSSIGRVDGGAQAVVAAFRRVLGDEGTLVTPAFSATVTDPCRSAELGAVDPSVTAARDAVPLFSASSTPTETGAIPTAVLADDDRRRSTHPQASVAAIGRHAGFICGAQPLSFALGRDSPFSRLIDLDATIVLVGVGHNRSSMLHHVESLLGPGVRRHWVRRFPHLVDGERVWVEAMDVGADNSTHFPAVGAAFASASTSHRRGRIGDATTEVFSSRDYVDFARTELGRRLSRV
ncbi:aminoglycoside N(3)-acetyltransferase [Williamsia deligens]|uniref:Aminoglycoside N(3)-acetyltransferase n=1 Tax=Williamsia deligens TaxID=321325 RepID=A0ABW3GCV6_9NOCA|nr:AAC(3) family N-acetyltransferase [Williamsia deligens]MCP2195481.1 aminoglycoside 3-N-acetyltransferase [Williamsia deligens]